MNRAVSADAKGRAGEAEARAYLERQGYEVLATRFRRRNGVGGEIDLIVVRQDRVAFVEVKAYRNRTAALEAIGPRSQARLYAAAEAWLAENPVYTNASLGFDLVLLSPNKEPEHIPNAWGWD